MIRRPDRRKEKVVFFTTIIMLILASITVSNLNTGLFKVELSQPVPKLLEIDKFSPLPVFSQTVFVLALIIIIGAVLIKGLNFKRIDLIKRIKKLLKKIDKIKGIEMRKVRKYISGLKPHKKIKHHYYEKVHPKVHHELKKTKDLFIEEYKEEYTHKFIAITFIVVIVGMSVLAINPVFNKGIISNKEDIIVNIVQKPIEYFSPEPLIGIGSFVLALIIILIAAKIKLKKGRL